MSYPKVLAIALALLAVGYAFGRFTSPEKIKIETKTVTVEVEKKDQTKSTDQVKVIKEVTNPDGTKTVETRIETKRDSHTTTDTNTKVDKEETKVVEAGRSKVTITALAGVHPLSPTDGFVFGGHVSRPILGPITIGAWGTSQGVFGMSLGLQF